MQTNTNFVTKFKDEVGRYAVAESDLKPGDLIFTETSFAFGPKSDSRPLCLGCHVPVDCTKLCSSCKWPVCGQNCETNPIHKNNECDVFTKANVHFQNVIDTTQPCMQYECITPLRVLLAVLHNNDKWINDVKHMEAHNGERRNRSIWKFNQINIVNYLRGPCQLKFFEEELIHTVCGILECNAFEARSKSGYPIRCLFPKLAILSHNCVSNIVHTIICNEDFNFQVTVRAATNISKGEELFSSYTYALWPTIIRREHLSESKYFHCTCKRCSDPTELGTHMSTLICSKCIIGVITANTSSENTNWECSNCGHSLTVHETKELFDTIQREIDGAGKEHLEELIEKYTSILHPHNSYLLMIKISLIPEYRYTNVHKSIQFCKDVLHILNVIEPGCTRIRGTTLYELTLASLTLINSLPKKHKEVIGKEMENTLKYLEECVPILSREPNYTSEGRAGAYVLKLLETVKNNFQRIISGSNITDLLSNI